MALHLIETETGDHDIKTALHTVLTNTPTINSMCIALIKFGAGAKLLDGTGGNFTLVITVGGYTVQPSPQTIVFSTATSAAAWTTPFPVPANNEVIIQVKSPNAADADVTVAVSLFDMTYAQPDALAGATDGLFIAGTNAAVTVTGTTTLTGNVSLGGTLGVTGATTLASLGVTGRLTAGSGSLTNVLLATTIESANRNVTNCQMATGALDADAYIGCLVVLVEDEAGGGNYTSRTITDYNPTNNVVTWTPALAHDPVDGGSIYIVPGDTKINVTADAILVDTGTTLDARIPAALGADGFMKSSIFGAMGTALTETAGQIAAAIKKLFDVATPVLTCESVNQAGDAHVHADAIDTLTKAAGAGDLAAITAAVITNAAGADVAADIIAVKAETAELKAAVITNAAGVDIAADIIALKAETVSIVADTNELQADWVNGGRLDLILDIIAADTTTDIPATITTLRAVADLIEDILRNKMEVTDADGKVVLYADDSATPLYTVADCVTDDSTTTTRKRLA